MQSTTNRKEAEMLKTYLTRFIVFAITAAIIASALAEIAAAGGRTSG